MTKKMKRLVSLLTVVIGGILTVVYPLIEDDLSTLMGSQSPKSEAQKVALSDVPKEYEGEYQELVLNDNIPSFNQDDLSLSAGVWQTFSDLDVFNRVGVANALIGEASFPTAQREGLNVKPTGWKQKKLENGQWLYNRSHLIGFQLTGENDNPKNLMTGTRQFNTPHMLNYENQIMSYIRQSGHHVRYRVTPYFYDDELVARGLQLEAASVESKEFAFNVYIYNIQDGYDINYLTGQSSKKR